MGRFAFGGHVSFVAFITMIAVMMLPGCCPGAVGLVEDEYLIVSEIDNAGDVGASTSIAVDSDCRTHISYYDWSGKLKYATNALGTWSVENLTGSDNVGWSTAIALDSDNKVHISYYTWTGELYYVTNAQGSWKYETVDGSGDVGGYTSIAVDSANKVHISYYDWNGKLKYATNMMGSWVTVTVDDAFDVGGYTSIAIDSTGKLHISYYDFKQGDLRHASKAPLGSWSNETIDSAGDVGIYSSIAVDASDKLHISYHDYTNKHLKYATNAQGSWSVQIVDGSDGVGLYSSIAADSLGKIRVSYYDWGGGLRLATYYSGSWTVEIIDTQGDVGGYTSIAVDSGNRYHISYYDFSRTSLKYASKVGLPTASAGLDREVAVDASVMFDGSASQSELGVVNYTWTFTDGVQKTLYGAKPTYTFRTLGVFTITLTVRDSEGLTATDTIAVTVVDQTSPVTLATVDGKEGRNSWYTSAVNITLQSSDAHSGVKLTKYRIDNGPWTTYSGPVHVASDGSHLFEFFSEDNAGNEEAVANVSAKVDAHAPVLNIIAPAVEAQLDTADLTVTWTCSDECSGVESHEYSIDGGAFVSCGTNTSMACKDLAEGSHNVTIRAADMAGNSAVETVTFAVTLENGMSTTTLVMIGAGAAVAAAVIGIATLLLKKGKLTK